MPPSGVTRLFFFNRRVWPDPAASAQMLADLSEALAGRGFAVHVIGDSAPGGQEIHRGAHIRRFGGLAREHSGLVVRTFASLLYSLRCIGYLLRHARRGDGLIVMTDPPLLGVLLHPFAAQRGMRLFHWWQDVYPEIAMRLGVLGESGLAARLLTALRNHSLRRALNVAISNGMKRHLERTSGVSATVIANWSASHDADPVVVQTWREHLGLQGKVVFAYSGTLGRAHEFDTLLKAATELRDDSAVHFLIIGGGAQAAQVQATASKLGLNNWTFLPLQPRERLSVALAAADVHLASLNPALESLIFPSKVQGILAAGRPCLFIGDPDGEVAQLLATHDCGESASVGDSAALMKSMRKLAADAGLRSRWGVNARQCHATRFTLTQAVEAWGKLLLTPAVR